MKKKSDALKNFEDLARKVIQVPKSKIEERERKRRRRKPRSKK